MLGKHLATIIGSLFIWTSTTSIASGYMGMKYGKQKGIEIGTEEGYKIGIEKEHMRLRTVAKDMMYMMEYDDDSFVIELLENMFKFRNKKKI